MPNVLENAAAIALLVTPSVDGVHRVIAEGSTVGYVLEAGPVFVALKGNVYNTSLEVGQSLDLDTAARLVAA